MSLAQSQTITQHKFLFLAANMLHETFVDSTRTQAKRVFKQLASGGTAKLTAVQTAQNAQAAFHLSLSHSEFRGTLNFSAFRSSVTCLVAKIAHALREEKEFKVFNALNGGGAMIFGVTAVTEEKGQRNVMVLAADMREEGDATLLQLMYLDPAQFVAGAAAPPAPSSLQANDDASR
jgi:hypothetical protein